MKTENSFVNGIRWTARITGTILVAFTIIFLILVFIDNLGENTGSQRHSLSTIIIITFIIWGIALAGLILALWKEGLGGCISLLGFITMCILNIFNPESKKSATIIFMLWMIPSLIYLYYWWKTKILPKVNDNNVQIDDQ